jgi:hypothetical protein
MTFREHVNHRDQDTTGIAEGFHSSTKSWARSLGSESLRIDHLVHFLLDKIASLSEFKDSRRFAGMCTSSPCASFAINAEQKSSKNL